MLGVRRAEKVDWALHATHEAMHEAILRATCSLSRDYPVLIAGREYWTQDFYEERDPAHVSHVIGRVHRATPKLLEIAMREGCDAFNWWLRIPPDERAHLLKPALDKFDELKFDLAALLSQEVGKSLEE